jgi:hypothetical protein
VIEKFTDIPPVFLSHARIAEATIKKYFISQPLAAKINTKALAALEKNPKNRIAKKLHQIIDKRNNSEYHITEITIIM